MNCYLRNRTISAAVPRTAAAYPAQPGGEVCCGGKRGSPPALLRRLALCSPGTPHPANPPRPGPRLTATPHPHHPAPPPLSLPVTPRQPRVPNPTSPRPPFPGRGRLAPLCPAPPLSAATGGRPMFRINKTAAGIRLRGTAGPRTATQCPPGVAKPRPALSVPSRSARPVPAGRDRPAPRRAAPALRLPRGPHHIPLRPTHPALSSSSRPNSEVA